MQTVRLADYDWVIVNSSGGKDSQTALRFVMAQAAAEGFPAARVTVAHADLGRMEWPGTKELAQAQAGRYGVKFWAMARPQGDLLAHIRARGMFPDSGNRFCTSDHKRDQIAKLFTQLVASEPWGAPRRILNVMGMRAEESPARAKLRAFDVNKRHSNGRRVIHNWLPIHGWHLGEVWADIKASGVPYHKAYDLGMPRLSCCFCIFSPPAALMLAGKHNPELLAEYVQAEKDLGHTLRHKFSLGEVQEAIARGEDWGPASDWVM